MKKLFAVLFICILIMSNTVFAAQIDLDSLSLEELQELQSDVQNKIAELTANQEVADDFVISTDDFELTIIKTEFKDEVRPETDDLFFLYYSDAEGEKYLDIEGTYCNKSKEDVYVNNLPKAIADYNDGFIYKGFVVVEDSGSFKTSYEKACIPLATCHYHCLIKVPDIVAESKDPLFITFELDDGTVYRYDIRN